MKNCFFIGHREASSEIMPALMEAVEQHIVEYGVTEFIVGNYGSFDHMAARAVISAKEQSSDIKGSPFAVLQKASHLFFLSDFLPKGMKLMIRTVIQMITITRTTQ